MISKEEVKHIAKLSRLELTEKEIEDMQKNLSAILDYFDSLKKAPKSVSSKVLIDGLSATREDIVEASTREMAEKIIGAFPDKKDDYIKVKTIL
ncbi:MAG: Asp-tRNA(Asn)/Glu-tRNA(Gln) amidotransferase subunit GatC [Candidatus Staskawiczbacteria bacterium]|nr:Asp-tRNA(Asn)/Glu-tRNA(Gln) amidotransferase subunit GatC [Candidatus Staskawiczbacteria bacterium]